jgi:cell division protein FtsL
MARARRGGGGKRVSARAFIVLGLLGFLVVAMGVIARRTLGIGQDRALRDLGRKRDALDASRVKLEVEIRDASSRARLGPVAEKRLQMYVPADSQVIILPRDRRPQE